VELLIVIVVIGVLAAISIVAYSGVQSRANDSAVQGDLSAAVKALELFKIDNGVYPRNVGDLDAMASTAPLRASRGAYDVGTGNIYNYAFCFNAAGTSYGLAAKSKSGNSYYVSSAISTVSSFSGWGTSVSTICPAMGQPTSGVWGYTGNTQSWQSWVR